MFTETPDPDGVAHLTALTRRRVGALLQWRLKRVRDHIDRHIAEPLPLARLADAAGLSPMHFAAQFRRATGRRPHHYLLERRIERAKALLAGDETPLAQVALCVGFQGQSHFSTVFKRLTGETPGRWKQSKSGVARENSNSPRR
jgi:AraC-like DNA-binding protein